MFMLHLNKLEGFVSQQVPIRKAYSFAIIYFVKNSLLIPDLMLLNIGVNLLHLFKSPSYYIVNLFQSCYVTYNKTM